MDMDMVFIVAEKSLNLKNGDSITFMSDMRKVSSTLYLYILFLFNFILFVYNY